jgi:hypothetical protein
MKVGEDVQSGGEMIRILRGQSVLDDVIREGVILAIPCDLSAVGLQRALCEMRTGFE